MSHRFKAFALVNYVVLFLLLLLVTPLLPTRLEWTPELFLSSQFLWPILSVYGDLAQMAALS